MKSAIILRTSEERDLAAITAIYAHHVRHGLASFELVPPDAAEMACRRARVLALGLPHLVAELDGRVAGYAYAAPYRDRPAYRHTLEDSIYIAHDAAGRGAGRALLEALIVDCANRASIGVHAACGFKHTGLLPSVGFKFGRWVDSIFMQRELGEGDRSPPGTLPPPQAEQGGPSPAG